MTARNKGWQGNYFEDFHVGMTARCVPARTVTTGEVAAYIVLTGDRSARFCGPDNIVHPLITFHIAFGQTVRTVSLNAQANLGYAGVVWGAPVRVGDTIRTDVEVVGLKENSNGRTGVVYVRTIARNQLGADVLSFWRWVMVKKRDSQVAWTGSTLIPSLLASVDPQTLQGLDLEHEPVAGQFALHDYAIGERIHHYDGVTVQSSDHMSFTRLFQNSAKVHFNARLMQGNPLVYGGFVISHAYAIALNGLDARLGIAAINAGTHASPVYSGDTLYAYSDVLDAFDPGPQSAVGALRLRLVCVKDGDPSVTEQGTTVLDLDYWEIFPR